MPKKFYNHKPVWIMSIGFALILILTGILVSSTFYWMQTTSERLEQVVNTYQNKAKHAVNMRISARDRTVALQTMLILEDPFELDAEWIRFLSMTGEFIKHRERLKSMPLNPLDKILLQTQAKITQKAVPIQNKVAALSLEGHIAKARQLMVNQALPLQDKVLISLDRLIDLQSKNAQKAVIQTDLDYQDALYIIIFLLMAVFVVCVAIVLYILHYIHCLNQDLELQVKERTEALKLLSIEAENATRMKSRFLAYVSHEIRNPLHGLLGLLDMAKKDPECTPTLKNTLHDAEKAGDILNTLVTDVLDFSKIEAGKLTLNNDDYDLPAVLRNSIKMLSTRAKEKNLSLNLDMAKSIPQYIYGDAQRLSQVLLNLISNAIKFTEIGSVHVFVVYDKPSSTLCFQVWDTGAGITKAEQSQLFQPFVQIHQYKKHRQDGTGLGLNLTKELVELMGGKIQVLSQIQQGSIFEFHLPYTAPRNSSKTKNYQDTLTEMPKIDINHLLIVDDSPINLRLAQIMCHNAAVKADVADDGKKALEMAQKNHYDLILMDCDMPILDGFESTQAIRKDSLNTTTPVIAMTASTQEEARQHCLHSGMNDFLFKPYRQEDLNQILANWSNKRVDS